MAYDQFPLCDKCGKECKQKRKGKMKASKTKGLCPSCYQVHLIQTSPGMKEKKKIYIAKWATENRAYWEKYYAEHKEKLRQYGRDYWHKNKDKVTALQKKYYAEKKMKTEEAKAKAAIKAAIETIKTTETAQNDVQTPETPVLLEETTAQNQNPSENPSENETKT